MSQLEIGSVIPFEVVRVCIDSSLPCEEESCMATVAFGVALTKLFGRRNFYLRSTSGGTYFTLDGYRYQATWPVTTGKKIFRFDKAYRKFCPNRAFAKRNPEKHAEGVEAARAAIDPFTTKAVIHTKAKIQPKVSAARKKQINETRKAKRARDRANGIKREPRGHHSDGSRQLSF